METIRTFRRVSKKRRCKCYNTQLKFSKREWLLTGKSRLLNLWRKFHRISSECLTTTVNSQSKYMVSFVQLEAKEFLNSPLRILEALLMTDRQEQRGVISSIITLSIHLKQFLSTSEDEMRIIAKCEWDIRRDEGWAGVEKKVKTKFAILALSTSPSKLLNIFVGKNHKPLGLQQDFGRQYKSKHVSLRTSTCKT